MRKVPDSLAKKLVASADRFATGFDEVRMDDIAQVSGIPRATLYYYFSGKDEILGFLMDALLADFSRRVESVTMSGESSRARFSSFIETYLDLIARNPAASQLLNSNLAKVGKLPDLVSIGDAAFLGPIRQLLEDGIQRGQLRDLDVATAAIALLGAVSFVGTHAIATDGADVDPVQLAERLVDILWPGISAP
jgi:AcrR family transcriptional regulator